MHRRKVSLWVWIHSISNILTAIVAQSNEFYTFDNCDTPRDNVYNIVGAVVKSQEADVYKGTDPAINCTYIFMTPSADMSFLLQFNRLEIKKTIIGCRYDHLTITEYHSSSQPITSILNKFCGDIGDLEPNEQKYYTQGRYLSITWVKRNYDKKGEHQGFSLVLTALMPGSCDHKTHIRCSNNDCISRSLRCDNVEHCYNGSDEMGCPTEPPPIILDPVTNQPPPPTTVRSSQKTTSAPFKSTEEVYLWLPLIVVILFTGVMVTLILIGRKSDLSSNRGAGTESSAEDTTLIHTEHTTTTTTHKTTTSHVTDPTGPRQGFTRTEVIYMALMAGVFLFIVVVCLVIGKRSRAGEEISTFSGTTSEAMGLTDERNGLRVDVNGNPNYEPEPGMPSTPPPSYSVIERQTSYVSHISVSSSQMSEPPDYSDAIELPGEPGVSRSRSNRHSRRPVSRRNSGGSSASRFTRLRNRIFSRSMSATETRHRRSDASISSDHDHDPRRISEVSDIVFVEDPSGNHRNSSHGATATNSPANTTTGSSAPVDHSTPDPLAQGSNTDNTTAITGSPGSPTLRNVRHSAPGSIISGRTSSVHRSESQNTANTSLGSSDGSSPERVTATNIFAQIHSLNIPESDNELDTIDHQGSPDQRQSLRSSSIGENVRGARIDPDDSSGTTSCSDVGNVSEMALLSHAEPPDVSEGGGSRRRGGGNNVSFFIE